MDNMIVQWRGGGYDGCFWEPNTGVMLEDKWIPIISTGRGARDTREAFDRDFDEEADYVFELSPAGTMELQDTIRADFFVHTLLALDELEQAVAWKCEDCEKIFDADCLRESSFGSYTGDGGIGIISEDLICSECASARTCSRCDHMAGSADELTLGVCEYCVEAAKEDESNEQLVLALECVKADEDRLTRELAMYIELMPHKQESAELAAKDTQTRLADERNEILEQLLDV